MGKVELRLQVQLDRLGLHAFRRLPPGVGVAEGRVGHGASQVGQERQRGVAFGAFGGAAGLVGVGVSVGAVQLCSIVSADRLSQNPPTQSEVSHAGVAGPALTAGSHTGSKHPHPNTWVEEKMKRSWLHVMLRRFYTPNS